MIEVSGNSDIRFNKTITTVSISEGNNSNSVLKETLGNLCCCCCCRCIIWI